MSLNKFTGFTFNHMDQEDTPDLTPEQVKAAFDSRGVDLKTFLDALIDVLNSTTKGASGADNIAATAITNLDGATVQALLESLRNKLKATTDSASGADFVGATGITGLTGGTVQALLEALKTYIDTHKSSADHDSRYYTETEINAKVDMIKGSIASIDGVDSAKGNIDLVGGTGITITPDNVNKKITVTATGESAPAAHADSHITGDDVIIGTIDQSVAPSGPAIASELLVLLNNLANRIKTVSGETNWSDTPGKDLKILAGDVAAHKADGASHSKTARFVVGTSTAGWTLEDCDYLCDGTNDQEEIIQALNDLPATGGEVVILDGTYNITASINIPKENVSLRGNVNATILKRMYNSTNTDSGSTAKGLITLNGKSGCKIQGLQIDGNKATYTASFNYGIYLDSSSNNTVTGNTCNNNNYGIYLYLSSNNTVTGNTCNNNYYGIYLYSSSNNTVTGNTCNNNNYYGIRLNSSSNENTVTGNTCNNNNNYNGIYLSSSSNNTVTGNTCNNNNYGISLFSSSNNNTVTGNTCIRGTGQTSDYTSNQYTIRLQGTANNYNLISSNNCMGKAVTIDGGTSNTSVNNKHS